MAEFHLAVTAAASSWGFDFDLPAIDFPPRIEIGRVGFATPITPAGSATTGSIQLLSDRALEARFEPALIGPAGDPFPLAAFTSGIGAGAQTKHRGLTIPPDTPPGEYGFRLRILDGQITVADRHFDAALTIAAPTFETWALACIPDSDQRNPGDDPDHDSLSNLLEYALLLDPTTVDRPTIAFVWTDDGDQRFPALRFTQRAGIAHAVTITLETDTGGSSWTSGGIEGPSAPTASPFALTRTLRSPHPARQRQFLRLRLSQPNLNPPAIAPTP